MKDAPIRHAIEYALFRRLRRWVEARPHEAVAAPGRRIGRFAHRVLGSKRKLALRNVERVFPDLSDEERERIVRESFEFQGANFIESLSMARLDPEDVAARVEVEGLEHLEEVLEGDRGFFVSTGHYGSWELGVLPIIRGVLEGGRKFHAVARPLDNPKIDRVLRATREHHGMQVIDKAGAALRMVKACRRGDAVAILIDQHLGPPVGIEVPFFGVPAWTSPVLAALSLRTGAGVLPFTSRPAEPGRYRTTIHQPIWPEGEGKEAELAMTRKYLEVVESDIRAQPEYWLWMHRRWRA